MSPVTKAATVLIAMVASLQMTGRANGVGMPPPARAVTPREKAIEAYNSGIENRTRASKAEEQAAKRQQESDRLIDEKKARDEYEKAFRNFKTAADLDPSMPQAWNGMGFAYRKLGDYARALESYDRALKIAPTFSDAIEYRAEAYLALNRVDEAKQAYLTLFAIDRQQADVLMKAMTAWVVKRKTDPAGADPAVVTALDAWIKERSAVALETRLMGREGAYRAW
jgi:tetratricopeptide (TPR) repeat protein